MIDEPGLGLWILVLRLREHELLLCMYLLYHHQHFIISLSTNSHCDLLKLLAVSALPLKKSYIMLLQ